MPNASTRSVRRLGRGNRLGLLWPLIRLRLQVLEDRTAPASFQGIGGGDGWDYNAEGVSADGSVVVGSRSGHPGGSLVLEAFRWTASEGVVGLGFLPGFTQSVASSVSADGSVIVGLLSPDNTFPTAGRQAFRWTLGSGMVGLGYLPGGSFSEGDEISADGSVIVGTADSYEGLRAFRWTAAMGLVSLGVIPGGFSSAAGDVSADGTVVVGVADSSLPSSDVGQQAFRWTAAGGMVPLGGGPSCVVYGVSHEGSAIVGHRYSAIEGTQRAFRWTADSGFVDLGTLGGGSFANNVSADGSVVVGYSGNGAFRWSAADGMRSVAEILVNDEELGAEVARWALSGPANDCSADGRVIVGQGVNPSGHHVGWIARLDHDPDVRPTSLQGLVWVDFNNDGAVNFGEQAIAGVTITLTGTNDLGNAVNLSTQSDAQGIYSFANLRPSDAIGYTITEAQPAGYFDGRDTLGVIEGAPLGSDTVNDVFSGVVISQGGSLAENYNFGERPATTGGVSGGQTATIGFWQNRNGQNLIQALNGGSSDTQLGQWLAATLPNLYANLDGMTNSGVAASFKSLFARNGHTSPGGPPKTDAQIMATALAVYVTNESLAGTTAVAYGFQVSATGVGTRTFNVGNKGAAFGVANNSSLSVMDLLLAVNGRSHNGLLYDLNGDGQVSSSEASLRTMANDVFSAINETGGI